MPRFVLAGGLDHERAAFAAELADIWNSVPADLAAHHQPLQVLTTDELGYDFGDSWATGNWLVHGNNFTRQQAKVARYATHVVSIAFHESQIDGSKQFKSALHSRERVVSAASHYRKRTNYMFDTVVTTNTDGGEIAWNALTQMHDYLCSQKLMDHRFYISHLQRVHRQV
jgi:hypothetical protein